MTNVSGVERAWCVKGKSKPTAFDLRTVSSSSQPRSMLVNEKTKQEAQSVCHTQKMALCTKLALICLMFLVALSQGQRERPRPA